MFNIVGQTFAQRTLVNTLSRGQSPSAFLGWISFLARSQNFAIELQNRPTPKLLSFSGNTFHSIAGISNFEVLVLKNPVKVLLNSLTKPCKSVTLRVIISKSVEKLTGRPLQKLERVN
jgi:hypothetical protein